MSEQFFKTIGSRAQDADDRLFDGAVVDEHDEQVEHPVQQIESLCMDCGENVSSPS